MHVEEVRCNDCVEGLSFWQRWSVVKRKNGRGADLVSIQTPALVASFTGCGGCDRVGLGGADELWELMGQQGKDAVCRRFTGAFVDGLGGRAAIREAWVGGACFLVGNALLQFICRA